MEAAFVYGTIHQFVLTTEAALLKATRYLQTHPHHGELLPCTVCLTPGVSFPNQLWDGIRMLCQGWTVRSGYVPGLGAALLFMAVLGGISQKSPQTSAMGFQKS